MTGPWPVLVGADGSDASLAAVESGAREAALHGRLLRVVHVLSWEPPPPGFGTVLNKSGEEALAEQANQVLSTAVSTARATAPGTEVTGELAHGDPRIALAELSRDAALTVVGSKGHGSLASVLLGSSARHLAAHAESPVLIVRGTGRPPGEPAGELVLGVDGSPAGEAATAFAFAEAAARGTGLVALHAWSSWTVPPAPPLDPSLPYAKAPGELRGDEQRLLAEALSGWGDRFPQVEVERRTVQERTRQALIEASSSAQLLVVGARGRGGFAGLRLGSVSTAVLHHAQCPVAVVRADVPT